MSSSGPDIQGEGAIIVCQEILAHGHDVTSQTEIYIFCLHVFFFFGGGGVVFKTVLFLYRPIICPRSSIFLLILFFFAL